MTIRFPEIAEPSTPPTGKVWLYVDSADSKVKTKDDAGNVTVFEPGVDGNTLLNGSGAPSGGTGVDGDFYIDTTANDIYGPKAGGVWPAGVSIIGPAGAPGTIPGIGDTVTGATAGSLLFSGAAGVLAQDNANLFWDDTNNRLGIGTATPSNQLHIVNAATSGTAVVLQQNGATTGNSITIQRNGGGTGRGILLQNSGTTTGNSIEVQNLNATSTIKGIQVTQSGLGTGIIASTSNASSAAIMVGGVTAGSGYALYGEVNGSGTGFAIAAVKTSTSGKAVGIASGSTGSYVSLSVQQTPSFTNYDLVLPNAQGGAGTVLTNDGTGVLSWTTPSTTTVATDTIWDTKGDIVAATGADTAVVVPVGTDGQVLIADSASAAGVKWGTAPGGTPTGTAGKLALYDSLGDLGELTELAYDSASFNGENFVHAIVPTNAGDYRTLHNHYASLNPTVADADQNWYMHFYEMSAGDDNSGNQVGDATNGSMIGMGMSVRSIQTSNVGDILNYAAYVNLGNGTDPMTGRNVSGVNFNPSFAVGGVSVANLTGFNFSLNLQAGSEVTNQVLGISINGGANDVEQFYGMAQGVNFNGDIGGNLTGFQSAHGFTNVDTVQSFTDFNQQASGTISNNYFGLNFGQNLDDITGTYFGINVNPTIAACGNADGLNVNMSGVTSAGTVRAAYFNGDVQIDGALSFSGSLSIGQLASFSSFTVVDGAGNPSSNNGLVSQLNAAGTVANCDTIGLNTACLINLDSTFAGTSGGFGLGMCSLALPNVVSMESGCSLDYMTACVYATTFDAANTGGTIGQLYGARSTAINLGGTQTITRMYSFFADYFAGDVSTDSWGFYDNGAKHNWLANSLKIGGTSGSTDTCTNTSIALELHDKALRLATMDTTARNALTAVAGMVIFNTTTAALEYYDGSAWV